MLSHDSEDKDRLFCFKTVHNSTFTLGVKMGNHMERTTLKKNGQKEKTQDGEWVWKFSQAESTWNLSFANEGLSCLLERSRVLTAELLNVWDSRCCSQAWRDLMPHLSGSSHAPKSSPRFSHVTDDQKQIKMYSLFISPNHSFVTLSDWRGGGSAWGDARQTLVFLLHVVWESSQNCTSGSSPSETKKVFLKAWARTWVSISTTVFHWKSTQQPRK